MNDDYLNGTIALNFSRADGFIGMSVKVPESLRALPPADGVDTLVTGAASILALLVASADLADGTTPESMLGTLLHEVAHETVTLLVNAGHITRGGEGEE